MKRVKYLPSERQKNSVIKINNILMQHFTNSKLIQKTEDEKIPQNCKQRQDHSWCQDELYRSLRQKENGDPDAVIIENSEILFTIF